MTYAEKIVELKGDDTFKIFSERTNVPQSSLSHLANGIRKPSIEIQRRIVQSLKLPQDYFHDCDDFTPPTAKQIKREEKKTWVMHHTKQTASHLHDKYKIILRKIEEQELEYMQKLDILDDKKKLVKEFLNDIQDKTQVTTR